MRCRELVRVATADLVGLLPTERGGEALTAVAEATRGALEAAVRAIEAERRELLVTRAAVIAMGRLGSTRDGVCIRRDVLFVHVPTQGKPTIRARRGTPRGR